MSDNIVQFPGLGDLGKKPSTNINIEVPTYVLTIDEEIYEVYSVVRPRLKHVEWEVFTLEGDKMVQGPAYWEPMIIEGQQEIGDTIQGYVGKQLIMKLEGYKEDKLIEQWEFSGVYLSTESKGDRFVILFINATQFEV